MSAYWTFPVLLVHEEGVVAPLELENVIVQLVRHVVIQGQGVADQKIQDQRQQPEADYGKHGPDKGVGASPRCVLDDPDKDDGGKDGRTQENGTEVWDDGVLPEFYE